MKENLLSRNSITIKKNSTKNYLTQILLNTKNYLTNNKNFSKDSKEKNRNKFENLNNIEFPLIQSVQQFPSFSSKKLQINSKKKNLKKLLINTINTSKNTKEIIF